MAQDFCPADFITSGYCTFLVKEGPAQGFVLITNFFFLSFDMKYIAALLSSFCNQVKVNTVLGSNAPALTVKLVRASSSGSKGGSAIESQVGFLLFYFLVHSLVTLFYLYLNI